MHEFGDSVSLDASKAFLLSNIHYISKPHLGKNAVYKSQGTYCCTHE